ncbi:MAG TPA: ABC transporter ATP-binding protein [Chloroflexota bacterium]|nr:ABC transporter ATP-binding protein [Chloroflexota bacterium]
MLVVDHVDVYYGAVHALHGISLEVREGELVCLLGGNASGKSTTMKTILGLVKPRTGSVSFRGERIDGLKTSQIVRRGIASVPEARRIFPRMTVRENLLMGAYVRSDPEIESDADRVLDLFPRLRERFKQLGGTLSGGEQQMLAMARALMSRPKLICMDEPSMGLAPAFVERVYDLIGQIRSHGTTVLVVEQSAHVALEIADRAYVLQNGVMRLEGPARDLLANDEVRRAYLGEVS